MRAQLIIKIWLVTVIPIFALTGMSFSARAADITSNLIGHWPLDGNANDSSGNGNHGTLVGNPTWTTEGADGALYFDGNGDYVDLGNIEAFEFDENESFTISLWVKIDSYNHDMNIFGRNNGSYYGSTDQTWNLNLSGKTNFGFGLGDGTRGNRNKEFLAASPGEWYHIAVVAGVKENGDGTVDDNEKIKFYVDGELLLNRDRNGDRNITRTAGKLNPGNSFRIGGEVYYFQGIIDEVRVYSRALGPDDIRQLFSDIGNQAPVVLDQDITDPESLPTGLLRRDVRTLVNTPVYIPLNTPQFSNDMNKDALTFSVVSPFPDGSYRFEGTSLIYTPPEHDLINPELDFIGRDSLTFKANDGALNSNEATISIDVVLPAFPGAEGFGATATGGRGGRVVHVTTLADNGDTHNPTPGSLREALGQTFSENDPITIVFDVGGMIEIDPPLQAGDNFTLAGQTAPGGISIVGSDFSIAGGWSSDYPIRKNFIIRHMRFRGNHFYTGNNNIGSFGAGNAHHFILDHLSLTGAGDEVIGISRSTDYTTQWLSVEESGLWGQGGLAHGKGDHNFGYLNGYSPFTRMTLHHTLIANHKQRLPLVNYVQYGGVDFRNSVIYNWERWASQFDGYGKGVTYFNVIGNSYVVGPSVERDYRLVVTYEADQIANFYPPDLEDDPLTPLLNERNLWYRNSATIPEENMPSIGAWEAPPQDFVNKPWAEAPEVVTQSAQVAYEKVLSEAGAWPRDATTRRTTDEVRTGQATGGKGLRGPYEYFPETKRPADFDEDRDGMSDDWEATHGRDLNANDIVPPGASPEDRYEGYSYLEYYINELADNLISQPVTLRTIQTNVSPSPDSGAVLVAHGNHDQSLSFRGGYNVPYWFGKIDFGTAAYNQGSMVIMKAKPNPGKPGEPGYSFSHWQGGPVNGLTSTQVSFPAVSDVTITAVFEINPYTINVTTIDAAIPPNVVDFGHVAGAGTYYGGDTVTLAAYANAGYQFSHYRYPDPEDPQGFITVENPTWSFAARDIAGIGNIEAVFVSGSGGDVPIDGAEDLNATASIPEGATVLKFNIHNNSDFQAVLTTSRDMYTRRMNFTVTDPDETWSTSLYYGTPFRFPVIPPEGSALMEIPLSIIRNKDLTRVVDKNSTSISFNFYRVLITPALWGGAEISVSDVSFGRASASAIVVSNLAPVAHAGRDQITKDFNGDGVETVLLDGLQSCDQDAGLIVNWRWEYTCTTVTHSHTHAEPLIIEGPTEFAPGVRISTGMHEIKLTVKDKLLAESYDSVTIEAHQAGAGGTLGDVNYDTEVTMIDAILVAKAVVGIGTVNTGAADVDKSGTVTLKDAMLIAQYANRVITEFPE